MSVQHFKSLLFKSTRIQQEIEREQRRQLPNWMRLLKLKKLRLEMKDRLQEMARNRMYSGRSMRLEPVVIRSDNRKTRIHWEGPSL